MSIVLKTLVVDQVGVDAKIVWIDSAEDYRAFQELIQRGANLWPDAPANIKRIADMITSGVVMQTYYDEKSAGA